MTLAGLSDENAKVQAAAINMLNLAITIPELPVKVPSALVSAALSP